MGWASVSWGSERLGGDWEGVATEGVMEKRKGGGKRACDCLFCVMFHLCVLFWGNRTMGR